MPSMTQMFEREYEKMIKDIGVIRWRDSRGVMFNVHGVGVAPNLSHGNRQNLVFGLQS